MGNLFIQANENQIACIDGRPLLGIISRGENWRWQFQSVEELSDGEYSFNNNWPRIPGGGAGIVHLIVEQFHQTLPQAVALADHVMRTLGIEPSFHIDDGHFKLDGEISLMTLRHAAGCGFMKAAFDEDASKVVNLMLNQGWSVQVLGGEHVEEVMYLNQVYGLTINPQECADRVFSAFCFDVWFMDQIAQVLIEPMTERLNLGQLPNGKNDPRMVSDEVYRRVKNWSEQWYVPLVSKLTNGKITQPKVF